jgi:hypothetical protein
LNSYCLVMVIGWPPSQRENCARGLNGRQFRRYTEKRLVLAVELRTTTRNGWTTERRKRQATLIRQWRPGEHSNGPKSINGKTIISRNGYKGGVSALLRDTARARDLVRSEGVS